MEFKRKDGFVKYVQPTIIFVDLYKRVQLHLNKSKDLKKENTIFL